MRAPVLLLKEEWPLVAAASRETDFRSWFLRVRNAAKDSTRCIVYGWFTTSWERERPSYAGYFCTTDEVPATAAKVAREIGADEHLLQSLVADLPAERI